MWAVEGGNIEVVRLLLRHHAQVDLQNDVSTALNVVCLSNSNKE